MEPYEENETVQESLADRVAATVRDGKTRVWWLGGASLAMRTPRACLWVDPFFGQPPRPQFHLQHPPLLKAEEVAPITAVFVTHEHNDHCHLPTLAAFSARESFITHAPAVAAAKVCEAVPDAKVEVVAPGSAGVVDDVKFRVLPGNDPMAEEGIAYLLETPGGRLLHPGDSLYTPGFFRSFALHDIDAACFSVGTLLFGEKAYMTPEEFGLAAEESKVRVAVPVHWDLWEEARIDPCEVEDWGTSTAQVLKPGEYVELPV